MDWNKQLKAGADRALAAAPHHKKLILIHAGVTATASLLVALLTFLLNSGIAQTGGLDGMGLRSLLETGQSLLSLIVSLLLPFWAAGYTASMLRIAKGEETESSHLLTGFRRFWPFLRLQIVTFLISFAVLFVCVQVGSILFSLTPLAGSMYDELLPLMEQTMSNPAALDAATQQKIMDATMPLMVAMGVLCIGAMIPVSYFLRFATLRLLDAPGQGARAAVFTSFRLMRGNCLRLFRLDLHFWWFYLAQGAVLALSWGDYLLPAMGINLPMSATAVYLLCYALSLGGEFALYYFCRNRLEVTYAKFYLDLLPKETKDANNSAVL